MMKRIVVLAALAAAAPTACAQDIERGPQPQTVADRFVANPPGLEAADWITGLEAPWSLVFLPDGRALVSERPGRIRLIAQGRLAAEPVATVAVARGGEAGLMGLALHPRFPAEPYFYAMYTAEEGGRRINRVGRFRFDGTRATPDRIVVDGMPGASNHNGGRIAFGPDGMLYVGTGEVFQRRLAQMPDNLGGKVLRVTPDGAPAPDNPSAGSPVYTLGHRNVQGLAWHPETRELFVSEHGPSSEAGLRAHDEINVIRKGANYGWGLVVGAPRRSGLADPLISWNDRTTPPGGIAFWRGALYVSTLRSETLVRVTLSRAGESWRVEAIERLFHDGEDGRYGRLRDAVTGPDGALYVLTSNRDGRGSPRAGDDRILRITTSGS
jgi:quinoprotein glucose dehydrogenase